MSKALVRTGGSGIVPAVGSAFVPGLGQLINGEADKAIGVFVVSLVAGLSIIGAIPFLGYIAWLIGLATWIYAVSDAYVTGKRKR